MRRLDASEPGFAAEFDALVNDRRESDSDVSADVSAIIARVKAEGDVALAEQKVISEVSARLIVNRAAFKLRSAEVPALVEKFREAAADAAA